MEKGNYFTALSFFMICVHIPAATPAKKQFPLRKSMNGAINAAAGSL